eukprot:Opistho-1_new@55207
MFVADADRDRCGDAERQGAAEVGRKHLHRVLADADAAVEHIVDRRIARCALAEDVDRHAIPADHAGRRAGRVERILQPRQVNRVEFGTVATLPVIVRGVPVPILGAQLEVALHPRNDTKHVERRIGREAVDDVVEVAVEPERGGDAVRREDRARLLRQERVVDADRERRAAKDAGRGELEQVGQLGTVGVGVGSLDKDIDAVGDVEIGVEVEQIAFVRRQQAGMLRRIHPVSAVGIDRDPRDRRTEERPAHLVRDQIAIGSELKRAACRIDDIGPGHRHARDVRQTAIGQRSVAQVVDHHQRGNAVAGIGVARRGEETERKAAPHHHAFLADIFGADHDVAATAREILADQRTHHLVRGIATVADARLSGKLEALVFFLEDDVDGACDRVRTIDGSAADRDRLDPLDQSDGDEVEIDLRAGRGRAARTGHGVRRHETPPVDQAQRTLRSQAEEVGEALRDAERALAGPDLARRGGREARRVLQRLEHVGVAAPLDLLGIGGSRGLQRVEARPLDARSGDDDILARSRGFLIRRGCLGHGRHCGAADHHRAARGLHDLKAGSGEHPPQLLNRAETALDRMRADTGKVCRRSDHLKTGLLRYGLHRIARVTGRYRILPCRLRPGGRGRDGRAEAGDRRPGQKHGPRSAPHSLPLAHWLSPPGSPVIRPQGEGGTDVRNPPLRIESVPRCGGSDASARGSSACAKG